MKDAEPLDPKIVSLATQLEALPEAKREKMEYLVSLIYRLWALGYTTADAIALVELVTKSPERARAMLDSMNKHNEGVSE